MSEPRAPAGSGASDGTEHDAWLREALRHAPDAQAAPPANVSHAILVEARSQVRSAQGAKPRVPSPAANPLLSFWSWLARPPVAAGFASVMAATLVGMMWWDRPLDETMPKAPSPVQAAAPADSRTTAPTTAPIAAPIDAPNALPAAVKPESPDAVLQAAPARDSSPRRPEASEREDAPAKGAVLSAKAPPAEPPAPFPTPFPASPVARQLAGPAPSAEPGTGTADLRDALVGQAARAAPPAAAPPAPAAAPTTMRRRAEPAAPMESRRVGKDESEPNVYAPALQAAPGAGRSEAPSGMVAAKAAAPHARPVALLLSGLRDESPRWQRIGNARTVAADEAIVAWLAELDAASAGRWLAAEPAHAGATLDPPMLVLQRDGALVASLRFSGNAFVLESSIDGASRTWRAELPAPAAERLRASLPRLPP